MSVGLTCGVCRGRAASLPAREFSAPLGSDPRCPVHGFGQDVTRETFTACVEAMAQQGAVGEVKRERLLVVRIVQ